jgi:hypothetical protein
MKHVGGGIPVEQGMLKTYPLIPPALRRRSNLIPSYLHDPHLDGVVWSNTEFLLGYIRWS